MGDTDCITSAIRELSWNAEEQAHMDAKSKEMETEKEIIDLTLDEDDDDVSDTEETQSSVMLGYAEKPEKVEQ